MDFSKNKKIVGRKITSVDILSRCWWLAGIHGLHPVPRVPLAIKLGHRRSMDCPVRKVTSLTIHIFHFILFAVTGTTH
jgi:hypothetical protein